MDMCSGVPTRPLRPGLLRTTTQHNWPNNLSTKLYENSNSTPLNDKYDATDITHTLEYTTTGSTDGRRIYRTIINPLSPTITWRLNDEGLGGYLITDNKNSLVPTPPKWTTATTTAITYPTTPNITTTQQLQPTAILQTRCAWLLHRVTNDHATRITTATTTRVNPAPRKQQTTENICNRRKFYMSIYV